MPKTLDLAGQNVLYSVHNVRYAIKTSIQYSIIENPEFYNCHYYALMTTILGVIFFGFDRNTNKKRNPKKLIQAYKK